MLKQTKNKRHPNTCVTDITHLVFKLRNARFVFPSRSSKKTSNFFLFCRQIKNGHFPLQRCENAVYRTNQAAVFASQYVQNVRARAVIRLHLFVPPGLCYRV